MGVLRDRLLLGEGPASLRSSGTPVTEVVDRLAGDDSPVKLIGAGRTDRRRLDRRACAGRAGRRRRDRARHWSRPGRDCRCLLRCTVRARLGRGLSRRASPGEAVPRRRPPPDPRLLGPQPRRRPAGRRPGRTGVLGLLARHRPSPRARRRQCRLLVSPGRQTSDLQTARRGSSSVAGRAR